MSILKILYLWTPESGGNYWIEKNGQSLQSQEFIVLNHLCIHGFVTYNTYFSSNTYLIAQDSKTLRWTWRLTWYLARWLIEFAENARISKFWLNFTILAKFHNFNQFSQFQPKFTISANKEYLEYLELGSSKFLRCFLDFDSCGVISTLCCFTM